MSSARVFTVLLLVLASLGFAEIAQAADTRYVTYMIREDPGDPESDVIFYVTFQITAYDQDHDTIRWEVESVYVTKVNVAPEANTHWTHDWPLLKSADGLWAVTHADPEDPQASDFDHMPGIEEGLAWADGSEDKDLIYSFRGDTPFEQPVPFEERCTLATYELFVEGEEEPEEEAEAEPVEADLVQEMPVYE